MCGGAANLNNNCYLLEMQALVTFGVTNATGNISVDPLLLEIDGPGNSILTMDDNDWHLQPGSPVSVREGDLGYSAGFLLDHDAKTRTAIINGQPASLGWSIGAYEQD